MPYRTLRARSQGIGFVRPLARHKSLQKHKMEWDSGYEHLFRLRRTVARIGEADWFRWWESNALSAAGEYAVPRLFRRTPALSAAHVAFAAARARHDGAVPREPLAHLFNFGELQEGGFERWLIARKVAGWAPDPLPSAPSADHKASVTASMRALGIAPGDVTASNGTTTVALGSISSVFCTTRRRVPPRSRVG